MTSNLIGMNTKATPSHIKAIIGISPDLGFIKKEDPKKEAKKLRKKNNKVKKLTQIVEDPYFEDFIEANYDEYEDY